MFELFETPRYMMWNIHVHYSKHTGEWQVEGKSYDKRSPRAYNTYGTDRINATRGKKRDIQDIIYFVTAEADATPAD